TLDAGSYNATAAGHVSVIGPGATGQTKQIVAYLPELLRWCGLDPDTGRTLWQHRGVHIPTQIHSRSSKEYVVFSTNDKDREPELVRLDPKTGQVLWNRPTNGLDISGEGVTIGNRVWLPCDRSIAVYDAASGAYLGTKSMPFPVHKIRAVDERWYLFSDNQLYIFAGQGDFAPKAVSPVRSVTAKPTVIAPPPKTDWHGPLQLAGHLRVPIKTVSGYHEGEWSKSYTRSLPDRRYSLLYTTIEGHDATLCAVVREGARTQEGVQPPQIAWSAALNSPQLHGDHLLTFSPWELQVRNIYDLTDITRYRIPVPPSTVNSDSPRILGAAWGDDGKSIAIHLSSKRVHVIAVPSGKRRFAFDVPGDVSRIDMAAGNVSLSKHGKCLAFAAKTGKLVWEIPSDTLPDSAPYSVPGMFHGSRIHDGKKISDLVDARTGKLLLRGPGHWACTFRYSGDRFIVHHESAFQKPDGEPMPSIKKCFLMEGGGALLFHDDGRLMWFDGKREQQLKLGSHSDKQVKGYWTRGHGGHGKPRGARFRDQVFFGLSGQELLRWSTVDGRLLESSQALGKGRLLPFEHSLAVLNDGTLSFFAPQSAEGRTAHAEEKR
ncbi:MAG TPA: PQQ-binding-like beta-propeller repeat protein, partial [Pirellulaceae bacterium]|nr:PQQ-binding-like beta-propeller repeat protein [Pirellulaceae bacterium]